MQLVRPLTIDDFDRPPHELAYYRELVNGELVDVMFQSDLIPGFSIRLGDLFDRL
jgi:hypothetical protein